MEVLFKPSVIYFLFTPGLLSFIFLTRYVLSSNNNHYLDLFKALCFKRTKRWYTGFFISIIIWVQLLLTIHFLTSLTIIINKILIQ